MPQTTEVKPTTLFVALDVGQRSWKVAMRDGVTDRLSECSVPPTIARLAEAFERGKRRLRLPANAPVTCCYEAGRDGFWIHRGLEGLGVTNYVVHPASIPVPRRRKPKTDRIDARKLVEFLVGYCSGRTGLLTVVRIPTVQQEDERRDVREKERLVKERTGHFTRLRSLAALYGLLLKKVLKAKFAELRDSAGRPLPPHAVAEMQREQVRLKLVQEQIHEIDKARLAILRAEHAKLQGKRPTQPTGLVQKVLALMAVKGIGVDLAWPLVFEFFYRQFSNRKEVGAAAGFTPLPFQTGDTNRDQGISRTGNARIRWRMVELGWNWLRYQPASGLSRWFQQRWAVGKRVRRVGMTALARRLLIDLWRYLESGRVPEGVEFKPVLDV